MTINNSGLLFRATLYIVSHKTELRNLVTTTVRSLPIFTSHSTSCVEYLTTNHNVVDLKLTPTTYTPIPLPKTNVKVECNNLQKQ